MSIDYDNEFETMEVQCDECDVSVDFEGSFLDCIDQLKDDGWRVQMISNEYVHTCTDCAADEAKAMDDRI